MRVGLELLELELQLGDLFLHCCIDPYCTHIHSVCHSHLLRSCKAVLSIQLESVHWNRRCTSLMWLVSLISHCPWERSNLGTCFQQGKTWLLSCPYKDLCLCSHPHPCNQWYIHSTQCLKSVASFYDSHHHLKMNSEESCISLSHISMFFVVDYCCRFWGYIFQALQQL